jgi:hypothetical protein
MYYSKGHIHEELWGVHYLEGHFSHDSKLWRCNNFQHLKQHFISRYQKPNCIFFQLGDKIYVHFVREMSFYN